MMKKFSLLAVALLASGLAAAAPAPSASPPPERMGHALRLQPDREFMFKAAESNMTEIEAAKIALATSQDPAVRALAQRMLADHEAAGTQLKALADARHLALPQLPPVHKQRLIDRLHSLTGADFDHEFIEGAGVQAHKEAIGDFQGELHTGKDGGVQAFARHTLPALQAHLQMARQAEQRFQIGSGPTNVIVNHGRLHPAGG